MDRLKWLNLLFIEDNEEFAHNTTEFFNIHFKKVFHSKDTKEAISTFSDNRIDVIISDIRLSGKGGLDFIQEVREIDKECIIAVLSAYKEQELLLKAIPLNLTAYELKPIRYDDLIMLLKKISAALAPKKVALIPNGMSYNFAAKELLFRGKSIQLTKKEILFIELLIKQNGKPLSHERVQRDVWENSEMSDAAIKNMIFRLRKKVGVDFVSTLHGIGYRLSKTISF